MWCARSKRVVECFQIGKCKIGVVRRAGGSVRALPATKLGPERRGPRSLGRSLRTNDDPCCITTRHDNYGCTTLNKVLGPLEGEEQEGDRHDCHAADSRCRRGAQAGRVCQRRGAQAGRVVGQDWDAGSKSKAGLGCRQEEWVVCGAQAGRVGQEWGAGGKSGSGVGRGAGEGVQTGRPASTQTTEHSRSMHAPGAQCSWWIVELSNAAHAHTPQQARLNTTDKQASAAPTSPTHPTPPHPPYCQAPSPQHPRPQLASSAQPFQRECGCNQQPAPLLVSTG